MNNINEPGGLLDTVLSFALPGYGLLRNMKAMEDPQKYGQGTLYGMATNYGQSPMSLSNVGNNLGFGNQGGGWFSNMFDGNTGGFGGYGNSPYSGGNIISSLGGQVNSLGDDMSSTSSWTQQNEDDFASDIGVADWG